MLSTAAAPSMAAPSGVTQGQGQGHGEVLDDYWREFEEIEQVGDGDLDEEDLPKTPDEGEKEAQWLKDAGYEFIVTKVADGRDLSDDELEALTSSLTRHQAEAVKKRINTLTLTLRKKRGAGKVHVKDIFPTPDNSSPEPPSPNSTLDPPSFPSSDKTPSRQRPSSFLHRKGGYKLEGAVPELAKSVQQGVEALSFKERGTFHRPTPHRANVVSMPAIADADISTDFHLEQKENQLFEAKNDPLGVTFISDLSEMDVPKIRSLALIELTALFDLYDITYSQPKRKKKARDHGLFGVPLHVLVDHDQRRVPGVKVPLVFQALVTHLCHEAVTVEGILRIPGNLSRVKQLRQELEEKFYQGTFQWGEVMPNDCAALLKMFLRELPTPLLTYDYLEAFPQVENIPKALERLKALNLLVLLLPTEHREVLKTLLQFLRTVVSHSDANLMGLNNICMIMAPNLFLPPAPKVSTSGHIKVKVKAATLEGQQGELLKAAKTSNVIKMLIHYQHVLWTVPGAFLTQVRHQYTSAANRRAREKMKKKKKKDKPDDIRKLEDGQHGVIHVQCPGVTKAPYTVQLDDRLTAGDLVTRFRTDMGYSAGSRGSNSQPSLSQGTNSAQFPDHKTFLFEVGGNIGERLLDPQTRLLQLYSINPTADWVIRFNVDR